jgi:hypothetical protein
MHNDSLAGNTAIKEKERGEGHKGERNTTWRLRPGERNRK